MPNLGDLYPSPAKLSPRYMCIKPPADRRPFFSTNSWRGVFYIKIALHIIK